MTATSPDDVGAAARRWADFFEAMTPQSLDGLGLHCRADIRFRDPFNDVTGVDRLRRIFAHMFETLDDPRFTVTDISVSGRTAYLRWDFSFTPKGRGEGAWTISGMSEVQFDPDLKVAAHIDHWDAAEQFYARLPLLGWLIRRVRSKLSVE